mmetsp:Transcript_45073/g.124988  ORF Transcript_45073/g.124988 Transcript_45073/m.124988 type:complete len:208 (+) Transcript_45073:655-1278(+)
MLPPRRDDDPHQGRLRLGRPAVLRVGMYRQGDVAVPRVWRDALRPLLQAAFAGALGEDGRRIRGRWSSPCLELGRLLSLVLRVLGVYQQPVCGVTRAPTAGTQVWRRQRLGCRGRGCRGRGGGGFRGGGGAAHGSVAAHGVRGRLAGPQVGAAARAPRRPDRPADDEHGAPWSARVVDARGLQCAPQHAHPQGSRGLTDAAGRGQRR